MRGDSLKFLQSFDNKTVTLQMPAVAAIVLGIIGGVAQVLNYSVFSASTQLHAAIAVGLLFLTSLGVPPLTGSAFKAALHLPAWVSYVVGAALSAAMLALTTISMSASAHEWIAVAISVLSAWGFSASVEPIPVTPPKGA